MKTKILALIACLVFLATPIAHAKAGISVRAYANKNTVTIGDKIRYTIEITAPKGAEIQMPAFKNGRIGDFEIKDSSSKMTKRIFGRKTFHSIFFLSIYSVGKKEIPQIDITYKLKGARKWEPEKTKAIPITVQSVLPKDLPPDIKDIRAPAYYFEINWFFVGGIVALLIALVAAIIIFKKLRDRKPVRLPHETALEELEAIRAEFLRGGDMKGYFVGVSDCIRRYIERVFRLKAPEMTSEEFLNSLKDSSALTIEQKDLLKGFLNACDLVKFARYTPTSEETENIYVTARNFIEETKVIV